MTGNLDSASQGSQVARSLPEAKRMAMPPFDTVDADVVIRSSDGIHFCVHHVILSMGSAFCKIALQLQDPAAAFIQVSEDSGTLDTFLRVLYPLVDPEVNSLSHLQSVLAAGVKYDAPSVVASMRKALVGPHFLEADPVRVFAIACSCQLEEEARVAARRAAVFDRISRLHLDECPELNGVSAGAFFRLLQLNRTRSTFPPLNKWCSVAAYDTHVSFFGIAPFCTGPPALPAPSKFTATSRPSSPASSEADFVSCTSEPQSPVPPEESSRGAGEASQSTVQETDSPLFGPPLRKSAMNVFPDPPSARLDRRLATGRLTLASAWSTIAAEKPLAFYFYAVENGWKEEALVCARRLVQGHNARDLATLYDPKMETIGSLPYRRLLAYAQACRAAASADFQLRGLPTRRCPTWCGCHTRYPASLSTASPPEWLECHFKTARDALRDRPCRSQLLQDCPVESPFVVSFKASVIVDPRPCNAQGDGLKPRPSPFDGRIPIMWQCTAEDNVCWAGAVLRQYAAAVDRAVDQVDLAIA